MEVIILEGPAGSGKSTVLEKMERESDGPFNLSKGLELPRDHGGPLPSYARDMSAIYTMVCGEGEKIAFDRFWFSTLVYDSLRQQGFFSSEIIIEHRNTLDILLDEIRADFTRRGFKTNDFLYITFYFLLPSIQEIVARREQTEKEYPFDAGAELALFNKIYLILKHSYGGHTHRMEFLEWS